MTTPFNKRESVLFAAVALFLVVLVPVLSSAGVISPFTLNVWGKYLCYAILAISVDLLWGYTGLLSLGQALFFTLGGYMLGMNLMLMIGEKSRRQKLSCDLNRTTPRTCTPKIAEGDNFPAEIVDNPELRARMKELMDRILLFFENDSSEEE